MPFYEYQCAKCGHEEEAQAVRYHNGQYVPENESVAHRETKLTRLVQYTDNWAGGGVEDGK